MRNPVTMQFLKTVHARGIRADFWQHDFIKERTTYLQPVVAVTFTEMQVEIITTIAE